MVTLYTQPTCAPCKAVARRLTSAGIPFKTVDVTVDTIAANQLVAEGFTGTPVIQYAGELHTIVGVAGVIKAYQADHG